jgi:hypothetical protein
MATGMPPEDGERVLGSGPGDPAAGADAGKDCSALQQDSLKDGPQTWIFRVELPAGLHNPGRYMAAVLKWIWRRWGVKATAILDDRAAARPLE